MSLQFTVIGKESHIISRYSQSKEDFASDVFVAVARQLVFQVTSASRPLKITVSSSGIENKGILFVYEQFDVGKHLLIDCFWSLLDLKVSQQRE